MKKYAVIIVLLLCICLIFAGCDFKILSAGELIRPPKLSGESSFLQKAFEKSVTSGSVKMKTPMSGDNRSSYITFDIDKDGNDEGLVLYSDPLVDEIAHVAVFKQDGSEWRLLSDVSGLSDEIYEVSFNDINGDGIFEVLISWTTLNIASSYNEPMASGSGRTLSLYNFSNAGLKLLKSDYFTKMYVSDFNGDGADDIFLSSVNITLDSSKTTGRILTFNDDYSVNFDETFPLISMLDIVSIVSDNAVSGGEKYTRIYVDGMLSESAFVTDVIKFSHSDNEISLPLSDRDITDAPTTTRSNNLLSGDVDFDGIIEIPTLQELPFSEVISNTNDDATPLNLVVWSQMQDDKLSVDFKSIYRKAQNFYFVFEEDWISNITAVYNENSSLLVFYSVKNKEKSEQLFSITACSSSEWDKKKDVFELIYDSNSFVYGCKYIQNDIVTRQTVKDNFVAL